MNLWIGVERPKLDALNILVIVLILKCCVKTYKFLEEIVEIKCYSTITFKYGTN